MYILLVSTQNVPMHFSHHSVQSTHYSNAITAPALSSLVPTNSDCRSRRPPTLVSSPVLPSLCALGCSSGDAARNPTMRPMRLQRLLVLSALRLQDRLIRYARKLERLRRIAARNDAARRRTLVRVERPRVRRACLLLALEVLL
jgi:hypothetical protein